MIRTRYGQAHIEPHKFRPENSLDVALHLKKVPNNASISSNVLPLVSGNNVKKNIQVTVAIPLNKKNVPPIVIALYSEINDINKTPLVARFIATPTPQPCALS
ncbi:bub1-related [Striga asiatica]|uniref:Bub1-related n=1 Tax=Striga asiatica TaxID=4170 RepID=A0A5A7RJ04_STRAF|nr:bub1-related [Striga asiatica]